MTQTAEATRTYLVHVIDDSLKLHEITIQAATHKGVKMAARKLIQDRGVKVRYVESLFVIA